jgi:hypothetical protein
MKAQNICGGVLPIQNTQLSRGLTRLYQRLAGEIAKAETRERPFLSRDQAKAGMQQVAGLLELLGVNFAPEALKPVRTRPYGGGLLARGAIRIGVMRAVKASGGWLSVADIVQRIVSEHRLTLTAKQRRHLHISVKKRAGALKKAGLLERENLDPAARSQRWRMNPDLARASRGKALQPTPSDVVRLTLPELRASRQDPSPLPLVVSPSLVDPSSLEYR